MSLSRIFHMRAASILWVGKTGVPGVNHRPLASYTDATLPFETYAIFLNAHDLR